MRFSSVASVFVNVQVEEADWTDGVSYIDRDQPYQDVCRSARKDVRSRMEKDRSCL